MNESIGDFRDLTRGGARVSLVFHSGGVPVRWSQCSATAEYFAEYFADVHAQACADDADRNEFVGTLSYIVNELVENAVKFSRGEAVEVTVSIEGEELVALVSNQILATTVEGLIEKFRGLVAGDPTEMLIARVEANAVNPDAGVSGLGFLTMMADYGATLGWYFGPVQDNPQNVLLKTMARLPMRNP
jgi:hypothetical protein